MPSLLLILTFLCGCSHPGSPPPELSLEQRRLRAQGVALFDRVGWTLQWRDAGRLAHQLTQRHGDLRSELDALDVPEGATVADIGAGVGWYAFPMALAVGPEGSVLALDIQPEAVALLSARARDVRLDPWHVVQARQSRVDDCTLPESSVDIALMAHLGFYLQPELLDENVRMLASVYRAVRPGGRLEVLEYIPPGWTEAHMLNHLQAAGFTLEQKRYDALHRTWHCVFRKPVVPATG